MVCISFIFILILSVINISMTISSRNQGYGLLYSIADAPADRNELKNRADYGIKESPRNKPVRGFDAFRCFSVLYDNDNKLKEVIYNESSDLTKEEIIELAGKVMENPQDRGVLSKYLYITKEEAKLVGEIFEYRRNQIGIDDSGKNLNKYEFSSNIICSECGGTFRR